MFGIWTGLHLTTLCRAFFPGSALVQGSLTSRGLEKSKLGNSVPRVPGGPSETLARDYSSSLSLDTTHPVCVEVLLCSSRAG